MVFICSSNQKFYVWVFGKFYVWVFWKFYVWVFGKCLVNVCMCTSQISLANNILLSVDIFPCTHLSYWEWVLSQILGPNFTFPLSLFSNNVSTHAAPFSARERLLLLPESGESSLLLLFVGNSFCVCDKVMKWHDFMAWWFEIKRLPSLSSLVLLRGWPLQWVDATSNLEPCWSCLANS